MDKSQFDQILTPLIGQLDVNRFLSAENELENGSPKKKRKAKKAESENDVILESYGRYVSEDVTDTIVKLAVTQNDSANWQTLHHEILKFASHDSPHVRSSTLNLVRSMFEQVGEEYIVLLADTLPALAELLEDENEEVRLLANKIAVKLEQLSGEDLKQLLRS